MKMKNNKILLAGCLYLLLGAVVSAEQMQPQQNYENGPEAMAPAEPNVSNAEREMPINIALSVQLRAEDIGVNESISHDGGIVIFPGRRHGLIVKSGNLDHNSLESIWNWNFHNQNLSLLPNDSDSIILVVGCKENSVMIRLWANYTVNLNTGTTSVEWMAQEISSIPAGSDLRHVEIINSINLNYIARPFTQEILVDYIEVNLLDNGRTHIELFLTMTEPHLIDNI